MKKPPIKAPRRNLVGNRYGRLLVQSEAPGRLGNTNRYWNCLCDCGAERTVEAGHLQRGRAKSCGCFRRDEQAIRARTHGMHGTREYEAWHQMKARCLNQKNHGYLRYGGAGVTVCREWADSFEAFYSYVGPAPSKKHSIDRIDNSKGYEPGNVRWADWFTQEGNRSSCHMAEIDGRSMCVAAWCRELGLKPHRIYKKRKHGMDTKDALLLEAGR